MNYSVYTHAERPDLGELAAGLGDEFWPEYNMHGDVTNEHWGTMRREFPQLQFVLYDEEAGDLVAEGHTAPIWWDGTVEDLPAGFDGIFERAFDEGPKNTLCAMAAEIRPAYQGGGLARELLRLMKQVAVSHRFEWLLAAVRPSWKERYPLTPIDEYAGWARDDGLPFDPWIRVHVRVGGEILKSEPRSLRITGTVAEWEEWTQMQFPVSGVYVFPRGLALLSVDRTADRGEYHEPNVWLVHAAAT